MANFAERFKRSWNVFMGRDQTYSYDGPGFGMRPDRMQFRSYNAKSVIASIYNRIAVDVASVTFNHVRMNEDDENMESIIKDSLNEVLTLSPNKDQTAIEFFIDAVQTMFDEGTIAVVPIDYDSTTPDLSKTDSFTINSVRIGRITQWFPSYVRVDVYDDNSGYRREITVPKKSTAIIENPFYSIMNEPNSQLQRLLRVLNQIDRTNEQNSSGKLDLILQLPYSIKSSARKIEAENRRKDIEQQLMGAQYGIAYVDGTERITQLNRAVENNLWTQAKDLQADLYNQLGLTKEIFEGTANEAAMLNYQSRTIEPIASAFAMEFNRKWLSKTARTQHQAIRYYKDPFKLVPVGQIADIADKFTRNEILSSNELRSIIGRKPSNDPKADQLINSNLNQAKEPGMTSPVPSGSVSDLSGNSSEMMDSSRIQNAQAWLNQIGTQSVDSVENGEESAKLDHSEQLDGIVADLLDSVEKEIDSIISDYLSGGGEENDENAE